MRIAIIAAAALCLGSAAFAQNDPVAARQQSMKEIGGALGGLTRIVRGQAAYDADTVRNALTTVSTNMKQFPDLFPAGTETASDGGPAIWENNAEFRALSLKLAEDADAVLAAFPADQAAIGSALQTLGASCGTCHQTFRVKR